MLPDDGHYALPVVAITRIPRPIYMYRRRLLGALAEAGRTLDMSVEHLVNEAVLCEQQRQQLTRDQGKLSPEQRVASAKAIVAIVAQRNEAVADLGLIPSRSKHAGQQSPY